MRSTDISTSIDGTRLRLATSATGRFRVFVEGAEGPDWIASFGAEASLVSADVTETGLRISFRPAPDVAPVGFGDLELTAFIDFGSDAGRDPHRVVSIRISGPAEYPLDEYCGPTITPRADGSSRDDWRFLLPDGDGLWMRTDGTGPGARARLVFHEHRISLPMSALVDDSGAALMVSGVGGNDHALDFHTPAGADGAARDAPRELRVTRHLASRPPVAHRLDSRGRRGGARCRDVHTAPRAGCPADDTDREDDRTWRSRTAPSLGGRHHTLVSLRHAHGDHRERPVGGGTRVSHGDGTSRGCRRYIRTRRSPSTPADPTSRPTTCSRPGRWRSSGGAASIRRKVRRPAGRRISSTTRAGWLNAGWRYLPFADGDQFWTTEEYLDASGEVGRRARAVHNATTVQTYRRCPSRHRHVVEEHGIPMLESLGATALFYDIATAMYALECYSPDHPVHRIEDIEHRLGILDLLGEPGRLVHSEAGKWWGIDHVNTFEGLFSYDWEFNIGSIQLEDYPVNPSAVRSSSTSSTACRSSEWSLVTLSHAPCGGEPGRTGTRRRGDRTTRSPLSSEPIPSTSSTPITL